MNGSLQIEEVDVNEYSVGRRWCGWCVGVSGRIAAVVAAVGLALVGTDWARAQGDGEALVDGGAPAQSGCVVTGTKTARPERVLLGSEIEVELTLVIDCPQDRPQVDIVLALDRSGSMDDGPLAAAVDAARAFVMRLAEAQHRVAVVSFAEDVTLDSEMTHGLDHAYRALGWLEAEGRTNLAAGLGGSLQVLEAEARAAARKVVVVLTDGHDTVGSDPIAVARRLRDAGVTVYAIGLGSVDHEVLRQVATTPEDYRHAPGPGELRAIYDGLVGPVTRPAPGDVVVEDLVAPDIAYAADSAEPVPQVSGSRLTWTHGDRPAQPMRMVYRARPTRVGILPVNTRASAHYDDVDGTRREFVFPVPVVEVYAPSPTPTATATATATPRPTCAPVPRLAYLPWVGQERCYEKQLPIDAVLVIDASGSMGGSKIVAARDAARAFVNILRLPEDRAGVVEFDCSARVRQPLTGDRTAVFRGIDAIHAGGTTAMHLGLGLGRGVIDAAGRDPGRQPIVVLLSDGIPDNRSAAAHEAQRLRDGGVVLYTVAFGGDADTAFLATIASPGRAYRALDREELVRSFEEIARRVICR